MLHYLPLRCSNRNTVRFCLTYTGYTYRLFLIFNNINIRRRVQTVTLLMQLYIFFHGATAPSGPGPPHCQGFTSHLDTTHAVGLLWTSDRPVAETTPDNTQHSQETDIHAPGGIRTSNSSKLAAAYPRLRRRGHSDQLSNFIQVNNFTVKHYPSTKGSLGLLLVF
jgi:hypothetical protein